MDCGGLLSLRSFLPLPLSRNSHLAVPSPARVGAHKCPRCLYFWTGSGIFLHTPSVNATKSKDRALHRLRGRFLQNAAGFMATKYRKHQICVLRGSTQDDKRINTVPQTFINNYETILIYFDNGFKRLQYRGRRLVKAEFATIAVAHNIGKMISNGYDALSPLIHITIYEKRTTHTY